MQQNEPVTRPDASQEIVEEEFYEMSETEEDIAFGQIVIITARWIMIAGALALTLWNPMAPSAQDFWRLPLQVALFLAYAVVNFFLQAQYVRQGPALPAVVHFTSLVDLGLITFILAIQPNQYSSGVFVFYFPALLALSVAFPFRLVAAYSVGVMAVYAMLAGQNAPPGGNGWDAVQAVSLRLIMMGAVAFCGALYQRIEHDRRSGKATPVGVLSKSAPQRRRPQPRRVHPAGVRPTPARSAPPRPSGHDV